jgi:hypothetical protein
MRLQKQAEQPGQRVIMNVEIHLAENREPAFMARPGTMRVIPAWDPQVFVPAGAYVAPGAAGPQFMAPPLQYFVMPPQSGPAPAQQVRFVSVPYPPQPVQYLPPQFLAATAPRPPPGPAPAGPIPHGFAPATISQGQLPRQPPYPVSSPYADPWPGQTSVARPGAPPVLQPIMPPVAPGQTLPPARAPPAPIQTRQPTQVLSPGGGSIDPDTPPIIAETGAGRPPERALDLDEADFIPEIESPPP